MTVLYSLKLSFSCSLARRGSSSNSNNTDTDCDEKEQLPIPSIADEQILLSSSTSNDTSSSEILAVNENKEPMGDEMEELKMTEQMHFKKTEDTEKTESSNSTSIFWDDVQTRTKALEMPSSFQRKRTNPY